MDIVFRIAGLAALAGMISAKEIQLKPGVTELDEPMRIEGGEDVMILGAAAGSTLRASAKFKGAALLEISGVKHLTILKLKLDGNRSALDRTFPIAPSDVAFADFYPLNGILIRNCEGAILRGIEISNVVNFPILVNASRQVRIEQTRIERSGSRDAKGKNNTSGGILFEEGTADFEVRLTKVLGVRGNGIWTHSRYTSPRNRDGLIQENEINGCARDAIQVGHATNVRVLKNGIFNIGFPAELVDTEHGGIPVGIDTAGNVDKSLYEDNVMREINGKCIDLDGFHHGEIRANRCVNMKQAAAYPQGHFGIVMNNTNPDMKSEYIVIEENELEGMKYGGIFLIGRKHTVRRNRMRYLNMAGCTESHAKGAECYFLADEPDMLRSGIYFGKGAERPDAANHMVVEDNLITGFKMKERCVAYAPDLERASLNVQRNVCIDAEPALLGKKKK